MPTTTPKCAIGRRWQRYRCLREAFKREEGRRMNGDLNTMQRPKFPIDSQRGSRRGQAGRWAVGGLLGLALAASVLSWGCSKSDTAEAAPTVTVQVGSAENLTIERKVAAEATLYPLAQASIVPKISAPIKKFNVNRGSRVHAGEVLAELENQDL